MKPVYKSGQCLVLSRLPLTPSLESPFVVFVPWYFDNYFFHLTQGEEYQEVAAGHFISINPHLGLDEGHRLRIVALSCMLTSNSVHVVAFMCANCSIKVFTLS